MNILLVGPLNGVQPRRCPPGNEVRQRNRPVAGNDSQIVQFVDAAVFGGIADADIQRIVGVVRPVFAQLGAVGYQLRGQAHRGDVSAVQARHCPVHLQLPFNARHRKRVLDIP